MRLSPKVSTHAIGVAWVGSQKRRSKERVDTMRENERVCYLVQVSDVDLKRE